MRRKIQKIVAVCGGEEEERPSEGLHELAQVPYVLELPRHRARSTWAAYMASHQGYARAASHGPKAPDRAGHCDAASRLGLFQRHRWRLRVREEPSVVSLDSSGATGGVLELLGDDYFI